MTININELRQLARAATPGPWVSHGRYIGTPRHMSYIGEVRDQCGNWSDTEKSRADAAFIAAANPATLSELLDRLEWVEKDVALKEQVIDALGSELNAVANERDALRAKIEQMEKRLRLIREEPGNTMSNSKALREMVRQARLALEESK